MPRVAPREVALSPDRARGRRERAAVATDGRRRVGEVGARPRRRRVSGVGSRPRRAWRGLAAGGVLCPASDLEVLVDLPLFRLLALCRGRVGRGPIRRLRDPITSGRSRVGSGRDPGASSQGRPLHGLLLGVVACDGGAAGPHARRRLKGGLPLRPLRPPLAELRGRASQGRITRRGLRV